MSLIDGEIAHIARLMAPPWIERTVGPILPASYWRRRLDELLDSVSLSQAQLRAIDGLMVRLDEFEEAHHSVEHNHTAGSQGRSAATPAYRGTDTFAIPARPTEKAI